MAGLPFSPISAIAGVASQIPQGILGAIEIGKANKGLKALAKEGEPNYSTSPELQNAYNRAQSMSTQGFTAEENAGFNQDLAMQNSAQFKNAVDMGGGNLASTINASLQGNNIQAINQHAGQGAQIKRSNIEIANSLADRLQSQQNLINQQKISRRNMLESAYGEAKKTGLENVTNSISGILSLGTQVKTSPSTPAVPDETMNALKFNPNDYNNG